MEKIKHILILLSLVLCFGSASGQNKSSIYFVCDVDQKYPLFKSSYGQRLWINIDFDINKFMITSHLQIRSRGDYLMEARDLVILPEFYRAYGQRATLNRVSLLYSLDNLGKAYCKKQSQKEYSRQVKKYLSDFKSKREI
tara:strand:- start:258 stop:677 length:420 start_codon:yes stop_codon:yes gene_type:complete